MSREHHDDPLARYLDDMLTEPAPVEAAASAESTRPGSEPDREPVPESDPAAVPADPSVAWWGFGVAHLILVLAGESVEAVREGVPAEVTLKPDSLVQGNYEMDGQSRLLVDVARLVLPAEHLSRLPPIEERAQGILHVRDTAISLLCGSEPMPVELDADEVRWRETAGSRRWMAGTVMNRSMVVLDVPGLVESAISGG